MNKRFHISGSVTRTGPVILSEETTLEMICALATAKEDDRRLCLTAQGLAVGDWMHTTHCGVIIRLTDG